MERRRRQGVASGDELRDAERRRRQGAASGDELHRRGGVEAMKAGDGVVRADVGSGSGHGHRGRWELGRASATPWSRGEEEEEQLAAGARERRIPERGEDEAAGIRDGGMRERRRSADSVDSGRRAAVDGPASSNGRADAEALRTGRRGGAAASRTASPAP